jgi:hypothetical protein
VVREKDGKPGGAGKFTRSFRVSLFPAGRFPFPAAFLFALALLFFVPPLPLPVYAQTRRGADADRPHVLSQSLSPEDFLAVTSPLGGYNLFIRKTPGIASVLLTFFDPTDPWAVEYPLLTDCQNAVNGDEIVLLEDDGLGEMRRLVDSTPEFDPLFGEEVFQIYLPPVVYVYHPVVRTILILPIKEGLLINVRAYNMPFADPAADFQDNQYTIASNQPEDGPYLKRLYNPDKPPPIPEPESEYLLPHPAFIRLGGGIAYFNPGYEGAMANKSYNMQPQLSPLGDFAFSYNPVPNFGFTLGYERDMLLMNRIIARIKGDWAAFGFEAGGFLGLLNPSREILSPGVSLTAKTRLWDGLFTARLRFDSALGRTLNKPGDFLQDLYEGQAAFNYGWFTFDILGSYRVFVRGTGGRINVTSRWLKLGGGVTLSADTLPFDMGLSGGYQTLSLKYPIEDDPLDYSYDNVFAGYNMRFRLPHNIELSFDLELPVSPTGYFRQFSAIPSLLRASIGLLWVLGK